MNQNILHVGLDVDDTQYHGAAFNKATGEVIDFKCRPTLKGLLTQLRTHPQALLRCNGLHFKTQTGYKSHWTKPHEDYRWITGEIRELSKDSAGGHVVSILEGGYDLEALATSARAHVAAL